MPRTLSLLLFAIAGGIAVFGQAMVLRDLFAGRTPAADTSAPSRVREVLWIVLPAVVLVALLVATWNAIPGASTATGVGLAAPAGL
jgi:heme/copper-type cytochrome/quinol oxidase subunit 2